MSKSINFCADIQSFGKLAQKFIGANEVEFMQLPQASVETKMAVLIRYDLELNMSNMLRLKDQNQALADFLDEFLTYVSNRISYGEIKTLRERVKNLEKSLEDQNKFIERLKKEDEEQVMKMMQNYEKQIEELQRYKHAYELNK